MNTTHAACGAPARIPFDHSAEALGDLAAPCTRPAGHAGDHGNGRAVWEAEAPKATPGHGEVTHLRLLPWPGPEGRPAYTPDDSPNGFLARMADQMEREQMTTADAVLKLSREMLDAGARLEPDECEFVMRRLAECLQDALRIAESRGCRLPLPVATVDDVATD